VKSVPKDPEIDQLLHRLDLDARGWQYVDNWDADMCAVGIGARTDPRLRAYVSTWRQPPDRYFFSCEVPTGEQRDECETVLEGEASSYEALLTVLVRHLEQS